MKTLITTLFLFTASISFSQKVDTVKNCLQIQPVVTNAMKSDTAYQLFWRINVDRGKTNDGYCFVTLYNRQGSKIQETSLTIPNATMKLWVSDNIIDDFLIKTYKLKIR